MKYFIILFVLKMLNNHKKYYGLNNLHHLDKFYGNYNLNNYTFENRYKLTGVDERYITKYTFISYLNNETNKTYLEYNKTDKEDYELFILTNNQKKRYLLNTLNTLNTLYNKNINNLEKIKLFQESKMLNNIKKYNISEGGLFNDYNFDFDSD